MKRTLASIVLALSLSPALALAGSPLDSLKSAAGDSAKSAVEKKVNAHLLEEARKNQCSFKTGTDQLAPGCDKKLKELASALIDAKRQLDGAGVKSYKFEVSGHTDSTGNAAKNRELSQKRAAAIVRELVGRGIAQREIIAVGMGSERLRVKPDNTEAKRAQNRRYELQVRL